MSTEDRPTFEELLKAASEAVEDENRPDPPVHSWLDRFEELVPAPADDETDSK